MYCVIQKIENKKCNTWGGNKELEAYKAGFTIGDKPCQYFYRNAGGKFERPIKTAYRISIHKSYRENGEVKKKQWVICTMGYYEMLEFWAGDSITKDALDVKLKKMDITEEQLWDMVYKKLQPIIDKIKEEFEATEEYKTKIKHEAILKKYRESQKVFDDKYGEGEYAYCYDIFGVLRNEEYLKELKESYKKQQEYNRSYYDNFKNNYKNYDFSGYGISKPNTYTEDEKDKLKKFYRTLASKYHPDITKDNGEMMKLVNKLKGDWGI